MNELEIINADQKLTFARIKLKAYSEREQSIKKIITEKESELKSLSEMKQDIILEIDDLENKLEELQKGDDNEV